LPLEAAGGYMNTEYDGIKARLDEFSANHGGTPEENQAIVDALRGLESLRKEVDAWQRSERTG
jgi:hypothetical protein